MLCPSCAHENIAGEDLCVNCGLDLAGLDVGSWGVDPEDPLLAESLEKVPLKAPLVAAPEATVADAIALMKSGHEGCVFVQDARGRLSGILSERDVVMTVAASRADPASTPVSEVMDRDVVTLRRTDPLAWALHRTGVDGRRHVAILDDDGRLDGFLSLRTVLSVLRSA